MACEGGDTRAGQVSMMKHVVCVWFCCAQSGRGGAANWMPSACPPKHTTSPVHVARAWGPHLHTAALTCVTFVILQRSRRRRWRSHNGGRGVAGVIPLFRPRVRRTPDVSHAGGRPQKQSHMRRAWRVRANPRPLGRWVALRGRALPPSVRVHVWHERRCRRGCPAQAW